MTSHGQECPCCRVAETLSDKDKLKWAAIQHAWKRLPLGVTASEIIHAAQSWRANVSQIRAPEQ